MICEKCGLTRRYCSCLPEEEDYSDCPRCFEPEAFCRCGYFVHPYDEQQARWEKGRQAFEDSYTGGF